MVRPIVNRFKDSASVAKAVAEDLYSFVSTQLASKERVDIALTGGTVGIASLAASSNLDFNALDLSRLHIWWGDERYVEAESPDRNAKQANDAWLKKLNIPSSNIHQFPALAEGVSVEDAAKAFNSFFEATGISFDLMLMGMGPDGHIASLFPGRNAGDSNLGVVAEPNSPKFPPERLSFSYRVINSARQIWFTVAGSDKAESVSVVFGDNPEQLPAGRVSGKEKTVWYIDQTAGNLVWGC